MLKGLSNDIGTPSSEKAAQVGEALGENDQVTLTEDFTEATFVAANFVFKT